MILFLKNDLPPLYKARPTKQKTQQQWREEQERQKEQGGGKKHWPNKDVAVVRNWDVFDLLFMSVMHDAE